MARTDRRRAATDGATPNRIRSLLITAANRGPDVTELHLLPTLWFRNDWSAWIAPSNRAAVKPSLRQIEAPSVAHLRHDYTEHLVVTPEVVVRPAF